MAASMLPSIRHMISKGTCEEDLGPDHIRGRAKPAQDKRLVAKLIGLGHAVEIKPAAA